MRLGDIQDPLVQRIPEGGFTRPEDARDFGMERTGQVIPSRPINIVELLPNFEVFHCRDILSVNPVTGALQRFTVGNWTIPWDAFVMSSRFEMELPDVVPLERAFIRVGTTIPTVSQATTITNAVNPFWTQISGTKGQKVRVLDPYQPYGRRVQKGGQVIAELQVMTTGAGAAFDVEYDVQIKALNLERTFLSAPG